MRDATIARNYAEAYLALATKAGEREGWGKMLSDLAEGAERDERVRRFLEAPQIGEEEKIAVLARAFADRLPRPALRFLQLLVHNRRQTLLPAIAAAYRGLLDELEGRVHATVTLARSPDAAELQGITTRLSGALGASVVPHVVVNPAILGGVVVRVGDTVMDGSVRHRLALLRRRMLHAPSTGAR